MPGHLYLPASTSLMMSPQIVCWGDKGPVVVGCWRLTSLTASGCKTLDSATSTTHAMVAKRTKFFHNIALSTQKINERLWST